MGDRTTYRFGRFEVEPGHRRLIVDGQPATVGQRSFDLLLVLIERRDRLVGKHELLELVWPGLVVEENNLQVQVSALRKVLGPQTIATIPGRGYRFTARLEGEAGAPAEPISEASQSGTLPTRSTNLPRELPTLYGRDAELEALVALLEKQRLVTVVGAGGIGKSRLAQAAAHSLADRWPDGAWMVELAGLSDPTLLANAVAQAQDIKVTGAAAAVDELVAGLARRHALLVLDNCEHLLDEVTALVQAVLQGAPGIAILATSQEPLRLPTEQQYRVAPLAVPSDTDPNPREFGALALLEARVRAIDPRFALNAEIMTPAIDICRRLDGLPLAIELAAARVATLGLRPVRDKLDARFKLLTGGSRATLRRHQTLRATLEWSYHLLDADERTVFRRLGAFAGGFTAELAQAVAGDAQLDEWAVLDQLSALVDKSLVSTDGGDAPRYRLLESARAFALEQLAASETADALERHALTMRAFIERVDDANLDGELRTDQYAAMVLPELDNLRAAYAWAAAEGGDLETAVAIAAHSGSLVDYAVECADWLKSQLPHVDAGAASPALAARYWRALAAGNMTGRVPLALQAVAAERAHSLYESLGQPRRVFSSLIRLSALRGTQGDDIGARAALDGARELLQPGWPPEFRILILRGDTRLTRAAGRFDEALALVREAVRACASAKDWRLEVIARTHMIDLLWEMGPIEEAAREARSLGDDLRARPAASTEMDLQFANLLGITSELGAVDEATAIAREAWPFMLRTGSVFIEEWLHFFWRRGQLDTAALLLGAADALLHRGHSPPQPNERRLVAQVRAALEATFPADTLAASLAAGAALTDDQLASAIGEALAPPPAEAL